MASIHDTMDYGYDPTVAEPGPVFVPPRPATPPPPNKNVNANWLPPVGKQSTPSCFVWASTYGLATFAAAQAGNYSPSGASQQASPAYTYVKVLEGNSTPANTCTGGQIPWCFNFLKKNSGTPSVQTAPVPDGCPNVWAAYGTTTLPSDQNFDVTAWKKISVTGLDGLDNVRTMIAQGVPLAYCTKLYPGFGTYDGTPNPYYGSGPFAINPNTGKLAGHCMMIIGYDDGYCGSPPRPPGAVLLQNSFGTGWGTAWNGSGGYVWMEYATFQTLAEGYAFYISSG